MRHVTRFLTLCALLLCAGRLPAAPLKVLYLLSPLPPRAGSEPVTQVRMRLSGLPREKTLRLQMPVWSPGDYHLQNHAKYVRNLRAQTPKDLDLPVTHPDENTWEIQTDGTSAVEVFYDLPNTPAGFFSENVKVTEKFAFYNGPATYLYVVGRKQNPATLHIRLPDGWKRAFTPLDPVRTTSERTDSIEFSAPDYDTLANSPVIVGDYVDREFKYADRPHTLLFFNKHEGMDYDGFIPILEKIVATQHQTMRSLPYKRYAFFFDIGGRGGGLEHLNACRIAWGRGGAPRFVAGFASHEYFHLWNVKRLRPAVLGPFDYVDPPKTRNLWFAEGVTSYYGDLFLCRAGLTSEENYLRGLSGSINALQSNPKRLQVTADESSLRVWEANNSDGYGGLSYYLKGELVGLCLDLKIRGVTKNRRSLDGVMRDMMRRYGLPKPGFPEDGIREAVIREGGREMGPFYDRLCRSTEEMPFAECLRYAGLKLTETDNGRLRIEPDPDAPAVATAFRKKWLTGR